MESGVRMHLEMVHDTVKNFEDFQKFTRLNDKVILHEEIPERLRLRTIHLSGWSKLVDNELHLLHTFGELVDLAQALCSVLDAAFQMLRRVSSLNKYINQSDARHWLEALTEAIDQITTETWFCKTDTWGEYKDRLAKLTF